MRRKATIITTLMACCTLATAQHAADADATPTDAMDQAVEAFLGSKELLTKSTRWSHAMEEYHFKYTTPDNGQPIRQSDIERLARAFAQNATHCTSTYIHNHGNDEAPFGSISYRRTDNYFSGISGTYYIDDDMNFRIVNFHADGHPTSYGILWQELTFSDRNGHPYRTIDGILYKFHDGIWQMQTNIAMQRAKNTSNVIAVSKDELAKYETLAGQARYLANLYQEKQKAGDEKSCDAAVYYLQKLFNGFNGRLTEEQYMEIQQIVEPFFQTSSKTERSSIVRRANEGLTREIDYVAGGRISLGEWRKGTFIGPDDERMVVNKYDMSGATSQKVRVSLSGTVSRRSPTVSIARRYPSQRTYAIDASEGHYTYNGPFMKDQLLIVGDEEGHQMVLIADSVSTEIDLQNTTLHGSRQNERFAECQRRLKALEPELHKYATNINGYWTVMDAAGYDRLTDDARQLQLQFIRENSDNMIPVWYLTENFHTMTLDELAPLMRRDRPYAAHPALQPVWQYYEGLAKRQPGRLFADAEATDTAGVTRRLADYIGHGDYVVLSFWDMSSRQDLKTLKALQQKYKGKNLSIVCVTLDDRRNDWKQYVRKRGLHFKHLMAIPDDPANRHFYDYGWSSAITSAYGVANVLPETILFSPDGHIVTSGLCGQRLTSAIERLPLSERQK